MPFVIRALQPLLSPSNPEVVQSIGLVALSRVWCYSKKGFSSLCIAALSYDLRLEERAPPSLCQLSSALTYLKISKKNSRKAKEIVQGIHACLESTSPSLVSTAIRAITVLCEEDALDFVKAWKVVMRYYPNIPESPTSAASWVNMMIGGLKEDYEKHTAMMTEIIGALWEATSHPSAIVRAMAYGGIMKLDWDMLETLDLLRSPLEFASLLCNEDSDPVSLPACRDLVCQVLQMEYADRRKQYIQLSSKISKQDSRGRFNKILSSIPKRLLKMVTLDEQGLDIKQSTVAVVLFLWKPRSAIKGFKAYKSIYEEIILSSQQPIIPEFNDFLNTFEGWKSFMKRWIHSDLEMDVNTSDGKSKALINKVWMATQKEISPSRATKCQDISPHTLMSSSALLSLYGEFDKDKMKQFLNLVMKVLRDSNQYPSLQRVCILLLGLLFAKVRETLGLVFAQEIAECLGTCWQHHDASINDISCDSLRSLSLCASDIWQMNIEHDFQTDTFPRVAECIGSILEPLGGLCSEIDYSKSLMHAKFDSYTIAHEHVLEKALNEPEVVVRNMLSEPPDDINPTTCQYMFGMSYLVQYLYKSRKLQTEEINQFVFILETMLTKPEMESLGECAGRLCKAYAGFIIATASSGFQETIRINRCISILIELLSKVHRFTSMKANGCFMTQALACVLVNNMKKQEYKGEASAEEIEAGMQTHSDIYLFLQPFTPVC